ncbi:MAG: hypothetical protein KAT16_00400 [Candidatus Heimdallarchaeota archaeon]|nr:hypothetical protein [Candidatus Heimdallarchaeota archaeon]
MNYCITIRKLDETGDSAILAHRTQAQAFLRSEQRNGNFIYIPESHLGVYSPLDALPMLQNEKIEILVFPPVMGG